MRKVDIFNLVLALQRAISFWGRAKQSSDTNNHVGGLVLWTCGSPAQLPTCEVSGSVFSIAAAEAMLRTFAWMAEPQFAARWPQQIQTLSLLLLPPF